MSGPIDPTKPHTIQPQSQCTATEHQYALLIAPGVVSTAAGRVFALDTPCQCGKKIRRRCTCSTCGDAHVREEDTP